ncbi:MAG: tetratricopeptide repeat protein, partial [Crocinitomicaceae bacterium]
MNFLSHSQDGGDQQLAQYYFQNEEYDKALMYYERLFDKDQSKFNFTRYLECLVQTGDLKTAEKTLKKQIRQHPSDSEYKINLATFYEDRGNQDYAASIYEDLIQDLNASARNVVDLYNSFKAKNKNDYALRTLQKGRKLLKNNYPLHFQFAEYYGSIGETEKMINEYLDLLDYHSNYGSSLKNILGRQINFEDENSKEYELLKIALIERIQKQPNSTVYADMLTWLFIQKQNFNAAFVQIKAMDKRNKSNGQLVFDLGNICRENNDFGVAKKCYQYVIELGEESPYLLRAQNAILNVRFLEITVFRNFNQEELNETILSYETALNSYGENNRTIPLILELSHIQAFYGKMSANAIGRLENALNIQGATDMQRAQIKMKLADIHVLHGDVWEASLLYMQVDEDFKYENIGHEAKFKNARIFYYDGEFNFAQSQLDILKQGTSQLIANDAMKLSLLITENFGLDSNFQAMYWFAQGDLLTEQHQYSNAFKYFDSIQK